MLVAYRLDRLSRTVAEALKLLALLKEARCALVLYSGQIDTSSAQGEAFYTIASVFGQLEAATISERTKRPSQLWRRRARCTLWRRCFGYNRDGSINKREAKILHQIAEIDQGRISAICHEVAQWRLHHNRWQRLADTIGEATAVLASPSWRSGASWSALSGHLEADLHGREADQAHSSSRWRQGVLGISISLWRTPLERPRCMRALRKQARTWEGGGEERRSYLVHLQART